MRDEEPGGRAWGERGLSIRDTNRDTEKQTGADDELLGPQSKCLRGGSRGSWERFVGRASATASGAVSSEHLLSAEGQRSPNLLLPTTRAMTSTTGPDGAKTKPWTRGMRCTNWHQPAVQ
jgi:hypothetical protein